jgi:ketosteroid isomerase-like protein
MTDNTAIADAFFDAIQRVDMEALRRIYDDDVEIWHNFADTSHGRDANLATLAGFSNVRSVRYAIIERFWNGEVLSQRHRLIVTARSGETFDLPVAIFITFRNGKIYRIYEYFDSAQLQGVVKAMVA